MNRAIKFRAWDSEANIMIYSDHRTRKLYDAYYGFEMNEKGELECRWEGDFSESHVLDGGILDNIMQYTGLKDKNGVEIYEGDILKFTLQESPGGYFKEAHHVESVEYSEGAFWAGHILLAHVAADDEEFEVLGSTYEHPHLLEGDPHAES